MLPYHSPGKTGTKPGIWRQTFEGIEIAIGLLCCTVTWIYTVQNELPGSNGGVSSPRPKFRLLVKEFAADCEVDDKAPGHRGGAQLGRDLIFRPSAGLMLFSCLVFGCCVSSFVQRRQCQDPFQFVFYLLFLGCAALLGYGLRAPTHLILLGYLPLATCAAMAASMSIHGLCRRLGRVDPEQGAGEKARF